MPRLVNWMCIKRNILWRCAKMFCATQTVLCAPKCAETFAIVYTQFNDCFSFWKATLQKISEWWYYNNVVYYNYLKLVGNTSVMRQSRAALPQEMTELNTALTIRLLVLLYTKNIPAEHRPADSVENTRRKMVKLDILRLLLPSMRKYYY